MESLVILYLNSKMRTMRNIYVRGLSHAVLNTVLAYR